MSSNNRGTPPTSPRDLPGPPNSPQEWEAALKAARRAIRDMWDATLGATQDAAQIVRYLNTDRGELASDSAMPAQRDRLTQCRARYLEAFNCGRPADSQGEWPALSPLAVYEAAAETPPYVVSSAAFNFSALYEFATTTLQIGWEARPGETWKMLWPVLTSPRDSPAALRLTDPERWDHVRVPALPNPDVVDAFAAAMSREATKAEQELRRRIEAGRHQTPSPAPTRPPVIEPPPHGEGASAPLTLWQLENELRSVERGEADDGPFCRSMDGSPVDGFSESHARMSFFCNLAYQKQALESSQGYQELRTLVIRRFSLELTPDACRQLRVELVRADISAAAADRMTLPEIVTRLTTPAPPTPPAPRQAVKEVADPAAADSLAGLNPSVRLAIEQYTQAELALRRDEPTKKVTDSQAHQYLTDEGYEVVEFATWVRYLGTARSHLGLSKKGSRKDYGGRSAAPPSHDGREPD